MVTGRGALMTKINSPRFSSTERQFQELHGDVAGLHVRIVPPSLKLMASFDIDQNRNSSRVNGITIEEGFTHLLFYNRGPAPVTLMIDPPDQTAVLENLGAHGLGYPGRSYEFGMFGGPRLASQSFDAETGLDEAVLGETLYLFVPNENDTASVDLILKGYGREARNIVTLASLGLLE